MVNFKRVLTPHAELLGKALSVHTRHSRNNPTQLPLNACVREYLTNNRRIDNNHLAHRESRQIYHCAFYQTQESAKIRFDAQQYP